MPYNYNIYNRPKKSNRNNRSDHQPGHRMEFERNRKRILASQEVCALCGQKVDKNLKYPHPMSATVDHIIPLNKGGHPSDINNLQLAHFCCNRQKSDKILTNEPEEQKSGELRNTELPLSINWVLYNEDNQEQLMEEMKKIEATGKHFYAH